MKVGGPSLVLTLGFDPLLGVKNELFLVALFYSHLFLSDLRGVGASELTLVSGTGRLGIL